MENQNIAAIKKDLTYLSKEELVAHILKLAKYKKENKELLSYLLFYSENEQHYIESVIAEMDGMFSEINSTNVYYVKKSVRKILRFCAKQIKFSGKKETEVEILAHFCQKMKKFNLKSERNLVLQNIYDRQLIKIHKALSTLHEDVQFDYQEKVRGLGR